MSFLIALLFGTTIFSLVVALKDLLTPAVTLRERIEQMMHQQQGQVTTLSSLDDTDEKSLLDVINLRLEGSGVNIKLKELVTMSLVAGVASLLFFWGATGEFGFGLLCFMVTIVLIPYVTIERRRTKRLQQIDEQLSESLSIMSSGLKSGLNIPQTFILLEDQMNEPIKEEFAKINQDLRLGENLATALGNFSERIPSQDVELFVSAVLIARRTGGNLSTILDNISGTVRSRVALKREIIAKTAMSRMSSLILSASPGVMFILLYLVNRTYISKLLNNPLGQVILVASAILNVLGAVSVMKLSKVEGLDVQKKKK